MLDYSQHYPLDLRGSVPDPLSQEDGSHSFYYTESGRLEDESWSSKALRTLGMILLGPLTLSGCGGGKNEEFTETPADDADADGDGYLDCNSEYASYVEACDCNDSTSAISPGVAENVENGIDDNCNGAIDEYIEDDVIPPPGEDLDSSRITTCDLPEVHETYTAFSETRVIPLAIHIVREDDGSGGLSDAEVDEAVSIANNYYDDLNVEFSVEFQDVILSSDYNHLDDSNEKYELLEAGYAEEGAINVYFVDYYRHCS